MVVLAALGLLVLAVVGAGVLGRRRWARAVGVLHARLASGAVTVPSADPATDRVDHPLAPRSPPQRYDVRELEGLPAPVQRYFRAVLQDGQPLIAAARIDMDGRFNLSATGERWRPFRSRQHVVTRRPGFVWDAAIALLPGVVVYVVDSYIQGRGLLRAAVQGLVTVGAMSGAGDIARGELMRWFAESPWYPTALLPNQGVCWTAVDDRSATATMEDGPIRLSLLFRFNADGLIDSFRAEARGSLVGDVLVMAPWEGRWSDYRDQEGMRVPFTGEVAWMRPEGRRTYFIGTVRTLGYAFAS